MDFYGGVNPYDSQRFGFGYIDTIQKQRDATASFRGLPVSNQREDLDDTTRHVLRIRSALEAVRQLIPAASGTARIEVSAAASVTSSASFNLSSGGGGTPTTIQSTEEVNAGTSTDYTDPSAWSGGSTAQPTVSGQYDGSDGTDTLRFEVTKGGTVGSSGMQVKVYDSNNSQTDVISIGRRDAAGTQYTLSNGLAVSFSDGDLNKNDTFTLDVVAGIEASVNPDNPFNGTGSNDPNLQTGLDVTAGSFQVNGTTIDVAASDSLNSVLGKINGSNAGVTATFDAASETVLLTQNTPGSTPDIVLENDTSGFLAAVKLDGAVATPGTDGEAEKTLAEEPQFAGVQSGSLSVNGTNIDIDINQDTLTNVLDRITASAGEVTASYDYSSGRVSIFADNAERQIELNSGTTNFFTAVNIADGTYEPVNETIEVQTGGVDVVNESDLTAKYAQAYNAELAAKAGADESAAAAPVSSAESKMLGKLVDIMADSMNALFDDSAISSSSGAGIEGLRDEVRSAITSWFDSEGPQFNTDFGIGFDLEKTEGSFFKFSQADRSRFEDALSSPQSAAAVHEALFGTKSGGLFNQLHSVLTAAGGESNGFSTGLFVDLSI